MRYDFFVYFFSALLIILPFLKIRKINRKQHKILIRGATIVCAVLILFFSILDSIQTTNESTSSNEKIDSLLKLNEELSYKSDSSDLRVGSLIIINKELNNKVDSLNVSLKPFIEIASSEFPQLKQNYALKALQNKLKGLDEKVEGEINSIKNFKALVKVYFRVESSPKPFEGVISTSGSGLRHLALVDNQSRVSYCNSPEYSISQHENLIYLFQTSVTALSNSSIFKTKKNDLEIIKYMEVGIPFVSPEGDIEFDHIYISQLIVSFYINEVLHKTIDEKYTRPYKVDLIKDETGDLIGVFGLENPFNRKT